MAVKTWDTSRTGGGTYELEKDSSGNYQLKSVGFAQVNKLNLPDLATSDTTAATTTPKTEDKKIEVADPFKKLGTQNTGGGQGGGQDYSGVMLKTPEVKDVSVRDAGSSMPQGSPGQLSKDKARAEANVELGLEPQAYKSPTMTTKENEFAQGKYTGVQTGLQKVTSAISNTVQNIMNNSATVAVAKGAASIVGGMINATTSQYQQDLNTANKNALTALGYKTNYELGNMNDPGRVAGNPANNVFAGMNAQSAKGDISKGAASRIGVRNSAKTQARVAKKGKAALDAFNAKTKEFEKQKADHDAAAAKDKANAAAAKDNREGVGSSCFIAGTKVTMSDGTLKNIENIAVGDKVKGHKEDNTVIKLDPTLLANRKLYSFNNNEHYFFTSEHPFMTEEGWKSIKPEKTKERDGIELYEQLKGELKVGDKLVTDNGPVEIKDIKSKEISNPEMPLYNFNVSNDNSYIADDYVVHNKGCFIKGTLVTMADGSTKPVEQVDLGDEVAEGGSVFAVGRFLNTELYDYKGIKVSGSHMVNEDGVWIRVRDTKHGKSLGNDLNTVYVFGSENRKILINGILFTDYFEVNEQDKLIEDSEDFFNNWKDYGNDVDVDNVATLNMNYEI